MPNLLNNLRECLGFSHTMISAFFKVSLARILISSKLPIGVATMYKPGFILILSLLIIFLNSCTPAINLDTEEKKEISKIPKTKEDTTPVSEAIDQKKENIESVFEDINKPLIREVSVILPLEKVYLLF